MAYGNIFQTKKEKKSLTPGTPFEAGSPDPKSDALPPELQNDGIFGQKINFIFCKDFILNFEKKKR